MNIARAHSTSTNPIFRWQSGKIKFCSLLSLLLALANSRKSWQRQSVYEIWKCEHVSGGCGGFFWIGELINRI